MDKEAGSRGGRTGLIYGSIVALMGYALVFRGAEAGELADALRGLRGGWLVLAVLVVIFLQLLRTLRWGLLVRAVQPMPGSLLFRIASIGYMTIDLFPLRLGELVRPVLLERRAAIPFGAGTSTVLLERVMDIVALLALLAVVLAFGDLPTDLPRLGSWTLDLPAVQRSLGFVLLLLVGVLVALVFFGDQIRGWLQALYRLFPARVSALLSRLTETFIDATRDQFSPGVLASGLLLSALIWAANIAVAAALFKASGFDALGLVEATMVTLCVAAALAAPAPVGGFGVFEAGAVVGLLFFGSAAAMTEASAAVYGLVIHLVHFCTIVALGLFSLAWEGLSWRELWSLGARDPR